MDQRTKIGIAFGFVYVVWGSTFVAIRYAAAFLNPALMSGLRFMLASLALMGMLAFRRQPLRIQKPELGTVALLGLLMFTVNTVLVNYASRTVSAGLTALVLATIPLMITGFEAMLSGPRRTGSIPWLAMIAGFSGVCVLMSSKSEGNLGAHPSAKACAALLIAAAAWAAGSVIAHHARLTSPPLVLCAWQMLVGGVVNLAVGLTTGGWTGAKWSGLVWAAILYLAIFGSLASYTAYLFLLRNVSLSMAATYAYVNPLVAVLLGSTIQHEPLQGTQWAGMSLVIASVAVTLSRSNATQERVQQNRVRSRDRGPRLSSSKATRANVPARNRSEAR
jgi:drug/metabolite transporter (DMT)-like permease